jgi:hypothetical protein
VVIRLRAIQMLPIRMRGRNIDLVKRFSTPNGAFARFFYVSALGVSGEADRHPLICPSHRPAEACPRGRLRNLNVWMAGEVSA